MSESYIEQLVAKKPSKPMQAGKIAAYVVCVIAGLIYFVSFNWIALIVAVLTGVLGYMASQRVNIEYEYLYIDKEISIDRIYNREKRKHVESYQVDKMEIIAPENSYHLDDYKRREVKVTDYSSGEEHAKKFVFYYENNQKIIFEPNEEMMKLIKNVAPRKTFLD
ncbi:MAG: hypothetical protein J6U37_05075 [Lachnospiraceae bacterium]|nr:hypothetical protein [Lachnospiraceae bacterium]